MRLLKNANSASRWILMAGLMLPLIAQASTLSGTVTDKTTNRPAAGDKVVLLSLSNGMQQVASTKTNAKGHYTLNVPDSSMHLIRVDHEKATYYKSVPPGSKHVNVTVYDVAAKVPGVKTVAEVLRMQTNSQGLNVIVNYFVSNNSNPPKTQYSSEAYPIYLPPGAQIQGAQAAGPQGMPISLAPIKLAGKGHYAFVFPLRPGRSRFGISYMLPYSGSKTFQQQVSLPTGSYAVIIPNSMTFKSPGSSGFDEVHDKKIPAQTFVSRNVKPGQKVEFTVSGKGSMPRELQAQSGSQSKAAASGSSASGSSQNDRPGIGLGPPIDTPGPLHKYRWWIISGLGLILVIVAAFLLGGKKEDQSEADAEPEPSPLTPTTFPPAQSGSGGAAGGGGAAGSAPKGVSAASPPLLQALKEELFAVESERVEGKLTEEQYAEAKGALEIVLKRALKRKS